MRLTLQGEPLDVPAKARTSSSDPLVGGLPRAGRTRINGSRLDVIPRDGRVASGMGPELFRLRIDGGGISGGDEETRTPDPLLAKEMLYQLSYVPAPSPGRWWAILDSNQRPLPYQGSALTS